MEKMTNVSALTYVLENCELPQNVIDKLTKMKETFQKKNASGSNGKPTKTQIENEIHKEEILNFLETVERATITEIMKGLPIELSNQKVSAVVKLLINDNKVVRIEEKRKAYFSKA